MAKSAPLQLSLLTETAPPRANSPVVVTVPVKVTPFTSPAAVVTEVTVPIFSSLGPGLTFHKSPPVFAKIPIVSAGGVIPDARSVNCISLTSTHWLSPKFKSADIDFVPSVYRLFSSKVVTWVSILVISVSTPDKSVFPKNTS